MRNVLEQFKTAIGKPFRQQSTSIDNRRKVQLATLNNGRLSNRFETLPRVDIIARTLSKFLIPEGNLVHSKYQVTNRSADSPFGCTRPVEPNPRLDSVDPSHVVFILSQFNFVLDWGRRGIVLE